MKRDRVISAFCSEHVATRNFKCDHCGVDIWGHYVRRVLCRVVEGARRRYSNLYVERHCRDCM